MSTDIYLCIPCLALTRINQEEEIVKAEIIDIDGKTGLLKYIISNYKL